MKNWLKKNKGRLSLRGIETEIGCPLGLLSKVLSDANDVKLPEKWAEPLSDLVLDMNFLQFETEPIVTFESEDEPIIISDEEIKKGRKKGLSSDKIIAMVDKQKKKNEA